MVILTVGAGGTYATWELATAALLAASPLADDYDIVQVGGTNDTVNYAQRTIDNNGHNVTIRSNSPHGGNPTQGHKSISTTVGATGINVKFQNGGGGTPVIEIKDLNIQWNREADVGTNAIPLTVNCAAQDSFLMHDIISMNQVQSAATDGGVNPTSADPLQPQCWNIVTYGWRYGFYWQGGKGAPGPLIDNVTALNAGLYGVITGGPYGTDAIVTNCVASSFSNMAKCEGYNNASVDASAADVNWALGSDNETDIVPANEFVSTNSTNANFAKVKTGGVCDDGGTAPSIVANTLGIRGNARPHDGDYSIGADEYQEIAPSGGGGSGSSGGGMMSAIMAARHLGYMMVRVAQKIFHRRRSAERIKGLSRVPTLI